MGEEYGKMDDLINTRQRAMKMKRECTPCRVYPRDNGPGFQTKYQVNEMKLQRRHQL